MERQGETLQYKKRKEREEATQKVEIKIEKNKGSKIRADWKTPSYSTTILCF